MPNLLKFFWLACQLFAWTFVSWATDIPADLLIRRCEPAVYFVWAVGDIKLVYPSDPTTILHGSHSWEDIIDNPDRNLKALFNGSQTLATDLAYATGTAFAVSPDGILLTNAHVVSGANLDEYLKDEHVSKLVSDHLDEYIAKISKAIGSQPKSMTEAAFAVTQWFTNNVHVQATFTHAYVAFDGLPKIGLVEGKVIKIGRPMPGKDLAVLRLVNPPAIAGAPSTPFGFKRLICLPLGDSESVLPGTHVHSLGFPGAGYMPAIMAQAARYKVNNQSGEIGERMPINQDDWSAFALSAPITHGDSGGPVINDQGEVVAISVYGNHQAVGHNVAIPINLAKELLNSRPLPGQPLELWDAGLVLYSQGHFNWALEKFNALLQSQAFTDLQYQYNFIDRRSGEWTKGSWSYPSVTQNAYLLEMVELLRKKKGSAPWQ